MTHLVAHVYTLIAKAGADAPWWQDLIGMLGGWKKVGPYVIAATILIFGVILARSATAAIDRFIKPGATNHGLVITRKFTFYGIIVLAFILALNQVGVKLSGLLAAAGVLTVAISFAAQTSVSNVISGIFLLFDRPFSIGDTIKVDTTLGTVVSIGLLSSKMRTFDNLVVRIPNEALLKSTIINYSLLSVRRIDVPVMVSYEADIDAVSEQLAALMREHTLVLDEPAPTILTDMLTDTGVQLIARVWVVTGDFIQAKSKLSTAVARAIRDEEIPRPRTYWAQVD